MSSKINLRRSLFDSSRLPFTDNELHSDLVIKTGQTSFKCHRIMLAASCDLFRKALLNIEPSEETEQMMILPDFSPQEISSLLRMVYGKEMEMESPEQAERVMSALQFSTTNSRGTRITHQRPTDSKKSGSSSGVNTDTRNRASPNPTLVHSSDEMELESSDEDLGEDELSDLDSDPPMSLVKVKEEKEEILEQHCQIPPHLTTPVPRTAVLTTQDNIPCPEILSCNHCPQRLISQLSLNVHLRIAHGVDFRLNRVGEVFKPTLDRRESPPPQPQHRPPSPPDPELMFCDQCGDTFKTRMRLRLHMKKTHREQPTDDDEKADQSKIFDSQDYPSSRRTRVMDDIDLSAIKNNPNPTLCPQEGCNYSNPKVAIVRNHYRAVVSLTKL